MGATSIAERTTTTAPSAALRSAMSAGAAPEPEGEAQLRAEVERAWADVASIVDRLMGSGRLLDRDVLMDLARFLESATPAVEAYERLVVAAAEEG